MDGITAAYVSIVNEVLLWPSRSLTAALAEVEGVAVVEGANSWGEPRRSAGLPGRAESAGEAGASVSATVLVPPWIRFSPPQLSFGLPQHADEHGPQRPVLLAVDQQLGEVAALGVAPELADPVGPVEVGQHQDVRFA
jgi:hypothetical protein